MKHKANSLRKASADDLAAINKIIEDAIMSWDLPERVKRLSLSSYQYSEQDLDSLELMVAENSQQQITGVVAWEKAEPKDAPAGTNALLLHGIYVDPRHQHQGIGRQLIACAETAAREKQYDGLLVKAQSSAVEFFLKQGMKPLPVENEKRDYVHRYWKPIEMRSI